MTDAAPPPARRHRPGGFPVIATTGTTQRRRRPIDAITVGVGIVVLLWLVAVWDDAGTLANRLAGALGFLPQFVVSALSFVTTLAAVWAALLVIGLGVAGWRRRGLSRDVLLAAVLAPAVSALVYRWATGAWPTIDGWNWLRTSSGFPALVLVFVVAVTRTARPHLTRPVRTLGSVFVAGAVLGLLAVGTTSGSAVAAGYVLGLMLAAAILFVFGSPEGQPDEAQYRDALDDLGIEVADLELVSTTDWGAALARVTDTGGRRLTAKLYGRDAYDAQVLTKAWSFLWYQQSGPTLAMTRVQQVEHEAFLTLLAGARGARTSAVVTSGVDSHDNALIVLEEPTATLEAADPATLDDALLDEVWAQALALGAAGIVHGALHAGNVHLAATGTDRAVVGGFAQARLEPVGDEAVNSDRAELLVATAELVGDERAIAAARRALGDDGLQAVLQFLQPAALSRHTRRRLEQDATTIQALKSAHRLSGSGARVATLRKAASTELGIDEPEVEKLVRVSWGSVVMAVILLVAVSFVWSQLADIGWSNLQASFAEANWVWAGVGFAIAQLQSVGMAFAVLGACVKKIPLGPTIAEQFAGKFIDLAVPSSAGRIALNTRYFQKFGIPTTTALGQGALWSFGGFVVQILLVVAALTIGGINLNLDALSSEASTTTSSTSTTSDGGGLPGWLLVATALLVLVVVVAAVRSAKLRAAVKDKLRDGADVLRVLRDPNKVGLILFGNLVAQIVLAASLSACCLAFGYHISFWTLLLINTAIAMLAGILPIPGGMGVAEAGITAGLTMAGMPQVEAFGAMAIYRLSMFYLPPIWGYVALYGLRKREYL